MRPHDDIYHITEFYLSGECEPFCRRSGIHTIPRVGDGIEVRGAMGVVVTVNWNLDYADKSHEQWRCSVYIKKDRPHD